MVTPRKSLSRFPMAAGVACFLLAQATVGSASDVDFERDILPILNQNCLDCHGPDEQESGFRVDSRVALLKGGDYGEPAVVPGEIDRSLLLAAVSHEDPDFAMPPDERLSDTNIVLLRKWISEGAVWPGQMDARLEHKKSDHWSFQPVARPAVPTAGPATDDANRNAIDSFLSERLAQDHLKFSAPADPVALIRRVSVVLTGLPPTPDEVAEFESAYQQSPGTAYERLVDRLLVSPHFGERWAQHWLDVIRWAETNGSESNMYRKNAWIYRDYVIRAFNEDHPYDQFLFDQIAGDTNGQGDATGYLVSGPHVPLATVGREETARRQARADRLDEVLQTVGASALGVTIGCARCHNHKFDPISIKDYYSMSAVFQDIEFGGRYPELADDHPRKIRGKELTGKIKQLRTTMRELGPWQEDWTGYQEFHFPPVETKSVRVSFSSTSVRIDELEIFADLEGNDNLALASRGTKVNYSIEGTQPGGPIDRVNDGNFGGDAWVYEGEKKKGSSEPWIEFTFKKSHTISRVRLSTNREDYLETDYLDDLNQQKYTVSKIEVRDEHGEWALICDPESLKRLDKQNSERSATVKKLQRSIEQVSQEGPKSSFVARFIEPAKSFVFSRGSPENPSDEVFSAGLSELGGDLGLEPDATGKQRRVAFGNWVIAHKNPLTSRVAVNRFWHHVFGQGIVTTTSDFGAAGAAPTHPELLDWLAAEFVHPADGQSRPWSMKRMVKLMVMSDAFRQSSFPDADAIGVDAGSSLLWRYPPKRMEAEVIRDSILLASDKLNRKIGGRSFRIHNVKQRYAQWEIEDNHGPETWRRMIYQERMRRVDDQMFSAFDFPDCGQVRAKRPVSTTPLQALNLLNSDFVLEQAELIAVRAQNESGGELKPAIVRCYEILFSRKPAAVELEACMELAEKTDLALVCRTLLNTNELSFLP